MSDGVIMVLAHDSRKIKKHWLGLASNGMHTAENPITVYIWQNV
jgi:hypothetical protein